jgi:nucleoside-diphosphate-sugar epimerase
VTEKNKLENAPNAYARSKYLGELEVWRGMAEGLPAVIVNPSVILGPGNWEKGSTRLFHYIWNEKPFYLQGKMNYIDVRDNATIIVQLLQQETISNERYILNAGVVSYQKLFEGIAHYFDKKTPGIKVSSGMIRQAARFDKLRATLTGRPQQITDELADAAKGTVIYSNNKILDLLGYPFRELDDTLDYACRELKNRYAGCNV